MVVSLDVDALFTSIPLDKTIGITINELFKNKDIINNLNNGVALINYIGHGDPNKWSSERIIDKERDLSLINISNIIDQNLIASYNKINDGVDSIFTLDNNIIIHSNRRILSLQTSSRVFRSLLNWQNIFSDDIVSVNIILKNIFVLTRSGGLFCVDGNNGEIKAESRVNDYSNVSFYHDSTKNSLVVFDGSFLMGLDPNNGKSLWKIREFSHKHFIHSLIDNIQLSGNRLVVLSPPEEKSQLIIKTYNRNTGELLWLSDEKLWASYSDEVLKKGKTFT